MNALKNVVLVHGAFADGSSWSEVIPLLLDKGLNVVAVQNPLTSLEDDVAAAKRAIELMDGPVLLVGHSYGGMVATEAGNDPKVAGLLYVCALIPDDGQTATDVTKDFPPPVSAEFRLDNHGFLSVSSKGIHENFAQDLPPGKREILFATQVPWSTKGTTEKITKAAWRNKPTWCLISTDDQMLGVDLLRAKAKMTKAPTLELKASHVPMLSVPDRVADYILRAVRELEATSITQNKTVTT